MRILIFAMQIKREITGGVGGGQENKERESASIRQKEYSRDGFSPTMQAAHQNC